MDDVIGLVGSISARTLDSWAHETAWTGLWMDAPKPPGGYNVLESKRPAKLRDWGGLATKEGRHAGNMGICILEWICRNFVPSQLGGWMCCPLHKLRSIWFLFAQGRR